MRSSLTKEWRETRQEDIYGAVTSYAYTLRTDAMGGERRFVYDLRGRVMEELTPGGVKTVYTRSLTGAILTETNALGEMIRSNLTKAENAAGILEISYDALYRVRETEENGKSLSYAYDADGNRLALAQPSGDTVYYTYDALGRIKTMNEGDRLKEYIYDRAGRLIKEAYSDGSSTERDYDGAGQLVRTEEISKENDIQRSTSYAYDAAGNMISEEREGTGVPFKRSTLRYYYDRADKLTRTEEFYAMGGSEADYIYDLAGNILKEVRDGAVTEYSYDAENHLIARTGAAGAADGSYDKDGNLVSETSAKGVKTYEYSPENRMIRGVNEKGETSEYVYNGLGVRTENIQTRYNENYEYRHFAFTYGSRYMKDYLPALSDGRYTSQPTWESEAGTTVQNVDAVERRVYAVDYLSPANRDIAVYAVGMSEARYVYSPDGSKFSGEFFHAEGTFRGESGENIGSDAAEEVVSKLYYHNDHLGGSLYATDAEGEIALHVMYDEWGLPRTNTALELNYLGADPDAGFTGYTYDKTLEIYFAQARFYDPAARRFTQEDPAKDGANWYVYCADNPVNFVDPWGLWTFSIFLEGMASGLFAINAGAGFAIDGEGNVGVLLSGGAGAGTPSLSGSGSAMLTSLDTVSDLNGASASLGASFSTPGLGVSKGYEVVGNGVPIGFTSSISKDFTNIPFELHALVTGSIVIPYGLWGKDDLYNFVKSFFDLLLECEKDYARNTLGFTI